MNLTRMPKQLCVRKTFQILQAGEPPRVSMRKATRVERERERDRPKLGLIYGYTVSKNLV